jgi:hypothetical protein
MESIPTIARKTCGSCAPIANHSERKPVEAQTAVAFVSRVGFGIFDRRTGIKKGPAEQSLDERPAFPLTRYPRIDVNPNVLPYVPLR